MRWIDVMAAAVAAATLSACGIYGRYERPDTGLGTLLRSELAAASTASVGEMGWREVFTDTLLQALIAEGLANNADLATARLKTVEASATLAAARKALLPSASLAATGTLSSHDGAKAQQTYSVGPEVSWEVDIFGKLTNEKRIQAATLEESMAYEQAVQTELVATIACDYYMLLMYDGQAGITRQTIRSWDEYIATQQSLMRAGQASRADVSQAEASKLAAEATLESLLQQAFELENSLSALVGRAPGPIARSDIDSQSLPDALSGGVDIATLAARPDVRQAEARLKQAFYSTNKARADFYPTVTLSGSAGWTNSGGAAIANPGAWLLQAVGSLVQPLFSQGRLKAGLQVAKAQHEEAVVAFRQSLLDAGTEVNNAMAAWQTLNRKVELQERQIGALRQAVSDTEATMRHGSANYLQVVVARQSLLRAQLDALADRYSRMESVVTLYKALGGGCR